MPIDLERARQLAIKGLQDRFGNSIELVRIESLHGPAYGFDPAGWLLFSVHRRNVLMVGGDWTVAIHPETGEFRDLGRLGD